MQSIRNTPEPQRQQMQQMVPDREMTQQQPQRFVEPPSRQEGRPNPPSRMISDGIMQSFNMQIMRPMDYYMKARILEWLRELGYDTDR